jgi:hypothetical protein
MMKAVRTSETSAYFNETKQRYILQICHLQVCNIAATPVCFLPMIWKMCKTEEVQDGTGL